MDTAAILKTLVIAKRILGTGRQALRPKLRGLTRCANRFSVSAAYSVDKAIWISLADETRQMWDDTAGVYGDKTALIFPNPVGNRSAV